VKLKQTRRALRMQTWISSATPPITFRGLPPSRHCARLPCRRWHDPGSLCRTRGIQVTVHPDKSIPFALGSKGVWEKNLESLEAIESMASPLGIQILLENMDRTFNTVDQIGDALARMPGLGFHLDVGHANLNVERNRTEEFLKAFRDRLVHVHLSDNFGKSEDLHSRCGQERSPGPR